MGLYALLSVLLVVSGGYGRVIELEENVAEYGFYTRIIGGDDPPVGEAPWMAQLKDGTWGFCGGTIIGVNWVLTAEHCKPTNTAANLPRYDVEYDTVLSNTGRTVRMLEWHGHPDYVLSTTITGGIIHIQHDAALIKTDPFNFNGGAAIASLNHRHIGLGEIVTIYGYGVQTRNGRRLKRTTLTTIPMWAGMNGWVDFIGLTNATSTSCSGDSGGPLIVDGQLAGMCSFGTCQRNGFSGYARASVYIDWIHRILNQ